MMSVKRVHFVKGTRRKVYKSYAFFLKKNILSTVFKGAAVAQLVEALRYKLEDRGFDSRWRHWNFSFIGITEMSTRNISCVRLTLPSSCADCLEIWEPQPPGTLRTYPGL
jgi:hypothetical protein